MSTTIDERVVEMRFDNKQFESNVSTTMSTLDKLKQKLNLDGASKGLENVERAAKNVDLSGLGSSADAVAVKFSHMQMSIQRVFDNIVDDAYNTGKRLVKSLSVDQIAAGWSKYGEKTASVQTIMNATGKSIDEVNSYLDKLMWFSDETSYGFTDMTAALGQMTSAGGDIDKLIPLITGVANATAYAGKGAAEFKRVMYNLNQSYSAGYLQYMDWKSLELAGMASKELKQIFIDTAEAMGKIKEGEVTIANFGQTLKDKWADTEVIEAAFGKFGEMTELAYEMVKSGEVELASEAYAILAEQYDGVSITAAKAAQEAKTFTEAIDATKDAVSSSWMRTFETIFGNYQEAKVLWTDVANSLWDIFASGGESRNELLSSVMDSGWDKFNAQLNDAGVSADRFKEVLKEVASGQGINLDNLIKDYGSLAKVMSSGEIKSNLIIETLEKLVGTEKALNSETKDLTSQFEAYQKIVDEVWHGKWGHGKNRVNALTEAGYNYDIAQSLVNISDTRRDHNITMEDYVKVMEKCTDAQLETIGYTEEEITALRELADAAKEPGSDLNALIESMQRPSGRELIAETITNSLEAIRITLDTIKTSWGKVFSIKPAGLYKIIKAINSFSKSLIMTEETSDKLGRTLQGVFSLLKIPASLLGGTVKIAFKTFQLLLDRFGMDILDFTASVGDAITNISDFISAIIDKGLGAALDWIIEKFGITSDTIKGFKSDIVMVGRNISTVVSDWIDKFKLDEIVESIGQLTSSIIEGIGSWIEGFKETEFFTTVAGWFESASQRISTAVDNITNKVDNFTASGAFTGFTNAFGVLSGGITAIATKLSNSKLFIAMIDGITTAFGNIRDFFTGFKFDLNSVKIFADLMGRFEDPGAQGFGSSLTTFAAWAKERTILKAKTSFKALAGMNWDEFKSNALINFTNFWTASGEFIVKAFESCKEVAKAIRDFIFGTEDVHLSDILDLATKFLGIVTLIKTIQLLDTLASPVENITGALENLASSMKWKAMASAFASMALALGAFTLCILVICGIDDMQKAWSATGMLVSLILALGTVVTIMGYFAAKGSGLDAAGVVASLLMLVGSIAILVYVLKEIDQLTLQDPVKTFAILFATLLAATMGIRMVAKAGGASFKSVAAILTLVSALSLILGVIKAYDEFDWTGKRSAIDKVMQMLVGLALAINIMGRGLKAGGNFTGVATTILAMMISLKLILNAIREIATMSDDELKRGGLVVGAMLAVMTYMISLANLTNKGYILEKGQKPLNSFRGFAIALLAVVAAIWLLGKMATTDFGSFKTGALAVAGILLLFTGLIAAIGASCSDLKMGVIGAMLAGFALLMAEMALILHLLNDLNPQTTLANAASLTIILAAMAGVMLVLKKIDMKATDLMERMQMFMVLSVVVGGLAAVLWAMSKLGTTGAIENATGITILLAAISGVMFAIQKLDMRSLNPNKMDKLYVIFGKLALVLALLGGVLALMSAFNTTNAIANATGLTILLAGLAGVTAVIGKIKFNKSATDGVIAFAELSFILFVLVAVLQSMNGVENAIANATALSILAIALSACTIPLAFAGKLATSAVVGGTLLVVLASVLAILVWYLSTITGVDTARENAITLANLAIVLSLCTLPLALCAVIAPAAVVGAGLLAALAVVLGLLVWGLSAIKDTATARTNVESIILLVAGLTAMVVIIGALGLNALVAVVALDALIGLIVKVGVLAAVVGLLTKDGGLIEKGLDILKKIAHGLGEIFGAFIGGLSSSLPEIGDNLLDFANSLGKVKFSTIAGAGYLAGAIVALLAADFITGIGKIFGLRLSDVATELVGFSSGITPFLSTIESVKPETFSGVTALCDAMNALTGATFWNGINDWLFGDSSLTSFGEGISAFAVCIKDSAAALKDITDDDVDNIKRSAAAGMALADLNAAIPGQNGLWQEWFGSKNLSNWGDTLVDLAECLIKYSETVSGKTFDKTAIENSAAAAQALSDVNNSIPASGGYWQEWTGEKNLSNWGTTLVEFGKCLVAYSEIVQGETFDTEAIKESADAAAALAEVNNAIPEADGLWQKLSGEQNLAVFGDRLKVFGAGLLSYSDSAVALKEANSIEAIKATGETLKAILEVVDLVPESGGWRDAIFGSNDAGTFGDALQSLSTGITDFVTTAETIGDASATVENVGKTLSEINTTLEDIPDASTLLAAYDLNVAMQELAAVADSLKTLAAVETSAIGLYVFRNTIEIIFGVFEGIDTSTITDDGYNIYLAAGHLVNAAKKIHDLSTNGYDYSGIESLKSAFKSISEFDLTFPELSEQTSTALTAVSSFINAMVKGLAGGASKLETEAKNLGTAIYQGLVSKNREMEYAGEFIGNHVEVGMSSDTVKANLKQTGIMLTGKLSEGVVANYKSIYENGRYLGAGLILGIQEKYDDVYWAAFELGQQAVLGEKAGQDSNSPSEETIKAGKWLGEGLVIGMKRIGSSVYNAGKDMGKGAIGSISNSISKISELVESGMDTQPTIRPVLDLSEVNAGIGTLGGMFGNTSLGVSANLRAISSGMNGYGQNGGAGDVVSAINKLRKDLSNISGNTYQINGVTYDDGSNIKDAVSAIVRQAKIERRV